jgi:hypothetical protein
MWIISHALVIWVALRRNAAIGIRHWEGPNQDEFEKKMFSAPMDRILDVWWFRALRAILIYGSMGFFFIWLHFVSL